MDKANGAEIGWPESKELERWPADLPFDGSKDSDEDDVWQEEEGCVHHAWWEPPESLASVGGGRARPNRGSGGTDLVECASSYRKPPATSVCKSGILASAPRQEKLSSLDSLGRASVPRGEGERDLRRREERILRSATSLADPDEARLVASRRKELARFLAKAEEPEGLGDMGELPVPPPPALRGEGKSSGSTERRGEDARRSVRLREGESGGSRARC